MASQAIIEPPSAYDWERFQHYARRVRTVYMMPPYEQGYSASYVNMNWEALIRYHPGERLLPNLRSFVCEDPIVAPYYHLFVQPTLERLHLAYGDPNDTTFFLDLVPSFPPSLKDIGLELYWQKHSSLVPGPTIQASIGQAVASMSSLTTFSANRIPAETLRVLSVLPKLETLRFDVYPMEHEETRSSVTRPYPFPALDYLVLSSTWFDITSMVAFFDRISAPKLETVRIRVFEDDSDDDDEVHDERPTAAAVGELTGSLRPFTTLRYFGIESYSAERVFPEHIATGKIVEPFLGMPNMESLDLGPIPMTLKPKDLARMARTWPHLERLELGHNVNHPPPTIKLEDLIPFALHCPKLRYLGLPLHVPKRTRCLRHALPPGQSQSIVAEISGGETKGMVISKQVKEFMARVFPHAQLTSMQLVREAMGTA